MPYYPLQSLRFIQGLKFMCLGIFCIFLFQMMEMAKHKDMMKNIYDREMDKMNSFYNEVSIFMYCCTPIQ